MRSKQLCKNIGVDKSYCILSLSGLASILVLLTLSLSFASADSLKMSTIANQVTVFGKVFNDVNMNGIQDTKEHGIPSVRLVTVDGLVIETDGYGRYSIPDNSIMARQFRNFILKIDAASLPQGSNIRSENPRVVRLSNGSVNKINFAITY